MKTKMKSIAFQGEHGAYSDLACRTLFPELTTLPCASFNDAFEAVQNGDADLAMIPVDNTIAGRVADVHNLLPGSDLFIIAEHFQPIEHALLARPEATIEGLKTVHSHVHALPQCKKLIKDMALKAYVHADTAGAAHEVSKNTDLTHCAIASKLAAEIYNLQIIKDNVQDEDHNTTRFLVLSPEPETPAIETPTITSLMFETRNIPAALYKSLGGFATNNLGMSKLESYVDENFQGARFYCDIDGHPETTGFKNAIEELGFYAKDVKFMGAYPAHTFRRTKNT